MEKELPSEFKEKDRQGIEDEIAELYAKGKSNDLQYKIISKYYCISKTFRSSQI